VFLGGVGGGGWGLCFSLRGVILPSYREKIPSFFLGKTKKDVVMTRKTGWGEIHFLKVGGQVYETSRNKRLTFG